MGELIDIRGRETIRHLRARRGEAGPVRAGWRDRMAAIAHAVLWPTLAGHVVAFWVAVGIAVARGWP